MSRRPNIGGLFRFTLCSVVGALALSGAQTPHAAAAAAPGYAAQGRVCLYVDVQDEFDRTVKAVTRVLGTWDPPLQEKLNRTIYKGLLNGVLGSSTTNAYVDEAKESLPEADNRVVEKLQEAGFVALAELAKKDYTLASDTSDDVGSGTGIGSSAGSQRVADDSRCGTSPEHCHSAASDENCPRKAPVHTRVKQTVAVCGGGPVKSDGGRQPIREADDSHVTAAGQSDDASDDATDDASDDVSNNGRVLNEDGLPIIVDDLYWSDEIEAATPRGYSEDELDEWKEDLSSQHVNSFEPGSFTKCGRDKNRFVELDDGSKLCVRYRYPLITSMTGELYSYHLARMLGITNLPPLHVSKATTNGSFWRGQNDNFREADWEDGKPVLLTKWIGGLQKAFLPETLVRGPYPIGSHTQALRTMNMTELTYLLQWSDLILFDYLIAHFDRFTINLSSVRYYNDTSLLRSEVHNLVRDPDTKQLWIVDNESGLLDGYSYLLVNDSDDVLLQGLLHEEMLHMLCLFRRSTGDRVRALLAHPDPARLLSERVRRQDPDAEGVFPALAGIQRHAQMLHQRLRKIQKWMVECQRRNSRERLKG